jgi:hypothetical protein
MITIRKTVIVYTLLVVVHLEPQRNCISTGIQNLNHCLISVQLISNGSSCEPLQIVPSSTVVLNQNRFGPDSKTINNDSGLKLLLIFLNL